MPNILDNPIWYALNTGNKHLALGHEHVKYIQRDVGLFAAFDIPTKKALAELAGMISVGEKVILFMTKPIAVTSEWRTEAARPLLQMVYTKKQTFSNDSTGIVPLHLQHVPAMLELTGITNPGPFFNRTIELGNYQGIFNGEQLTAMIGQRMQARSYAEVSAVCTHPDFTGRGYAAKLIIDQINKITAAGKIPFLHVYPDNPACSLYRKLGFTVRRKLMVYFLERV